MTMNDQKPKPAPRARPEIHETVGRLLQAMGPGAGKKVLDVPMGPGAMSLRLSELGYQVTGLDIDLNQSASLPAAIQRLRANLNEPLPLPDATFDMVVSLEGIEHLENHFLFLRELGRVIKPGGKLVISTPNICSLEERMNFLFRGSAYRFIGREEVEKHGSGFDHQNLISYVSLRQVLDWAGFKVVQVEKDRVKWKQVLGLWPLWLLIHLYGLVQSARRKQKFLWDEANSGPVLMGGATIIVVAQKN